LFRGATVIATIFSTCREVL